MTSYLMICFAHNIIRCSDYRENRRDHKACLDGAHTEREVNTVYQSTLTAIFSTSRVTTTNISSGRHRSTFEVAVVVATDADALHIGSHL